MGWRDSQEHRPEGRCYGAKMPREIPVGNGDLLINFDELYRVRDIYYPCVGRYNHTGGHVQRFGVWADGEFSWVDSAAWRRDLRYMADTLVTEVRLVNDQLGLELIRTRRSP